MDYVYDSLNVVYSYTIEMRPSQFIPIGGQFSDGFLASPATIIPAAEDVLTGILAAQGAIDKATNKT